MKLIALFLLSVAAFSSAYVADISLPQNTSLIGSTTGPEQLYGTENIQDHHPIAARLHRRGEPESWYESDLSDLKAADRSKDRKCRAGNEAWLESPSGSLLKRGVTPERVTPNVRSKPDFEGRVPSRPETGFRVPPKPEAPFRKPSTPELQQKVADLINKFSANKGSASGANPPTAPERPAQQVPKPPNPQAGGAKSPSEQQQTVADLINKFSAEGNNGINSPSTHQPRVGKAPKASAPQVGETVADLINELTSGTAEPISPDYEGIVSPKPDSFGDIRLAPASQKQPDVPSQPADQPTSGEVGDSVGQPNGIDKPMSNKDQPGRPNSDTKTPDVGSSAPKIGQQKPPSDPAANKLQDFGEKSHSLDEMKRINEARRKAEQEGRILEAKKKADAAEAANNRDDSSSAQPQRDPVLPENEAPSWADRLTQLRDASYETQSISDKAPSPDFGAPGSNPNSASRPEEWSREGFTPKVEGVPENLEPPPWPQTFPDIAAVPNVPPASPGSLSPVPQVPKPQVPSKLRPEQMSFKDKLNLWRSMCDDFPVQSSDAKDTWSMIRKFSPKLVGACEDGLEEMMSETAEIPGIPKDPLPKENVTPESSKPDSGSSNPEELGVKPESSHPEAGKEQKQPKEQKEPAQQKEQKTPKMPKMPKKKPVSKEDAKLLQNLRNEMAKSRKEREELFSKPDENSLPNGVTSNSGLKSHLTDEKQTMPEADPIADLTLKDGYFDTGTKMTSEVRKWKAKANEKPSKKEIKEAQKHPQPEIEKPGVEFPKGDVVRAVQLLEMLKKDAGDPSKTAATAEFVGKELKAAGFTLPRETITQMSLLGHEVTPEMETRGIISGLAALPYLAPASNFLAAPEILELGLLAGNPAVLGAVGVVTAAPALASLSMQAAPVLLTTAGMVAEKGVETLASVGLGGAQFVGMVGEETFNAVTEVASTGKKAGAAVVKALSTGWTVTKSLVRSLLKLVSKAAPVYGLVSTIQKPKVIAVLASTTIKTRIVNKSITEFITETIHGGPTVIVTTTPHTASKAPAKPEKSMATKASKAHKTAGHKTRSVKPTATKTSKTHKTKVAPTTSPKLERTKSRPTKPAKTKGSRPIPIPVPVPVPIPHHGKHNKTHANTTANSTFPRLDLSAPEIWWNRTRSSKPIHLNVSIPLGNSTAAPNGKISVPGMWGNGTRSSRPTNIGRLVPFNASCPAGNWTAPRVPWKVNISSAAILNVPNSVVNWSTPHLPSKVNLSNPAFGDNRTRPVAVNASHSAGNWSAASRLSPVRSPVPTLETPSPLNLPPSSRNQTTLTTITRAQISSPTGAVTQPVYFNSTSTSPANPPVPSRRLRLCARRSDKDKAYTIEQGDTIWDITQKYGLSVEELVDLNPDLKNEALVHPGTVVVLPSC